MSCGLTSGRTEPCRDNIGGVKSIYLFNYVDYPYTSIVGQRGVTLTSFPASTVFKYHVRNGNFSETIQNDENGISYDQSLSFSMFKQDVLTTNELNRLMNIDFRFVVEMWNGKLKVGGLFKGANISNLTIDSGGAKGSFNGYNVSIKGSEEYQAAFIDSINVISESDNYIFQDNNNFIFMDGNNYIFN